VEKKYKTFMEMVVLSTLDTSPLSEPRTPLFFACEEDNVKVLIRYYCFLGKKNQKKKKIERKMEINPLNCF